MDNTEEHGRHGIHHNTSNHSSHAARPCGQMYANERRRSLHHGKRPPEGDEGVVMYLQGGTHEGSGIPHLGRHSRQCLTQIGNLRSPTRPQIMESGGSPPGPRSILRLGHQAPQNSTEASGRSDGQESQILRPTMAGHLYGAMRPSMVRRNNSQKVW